MIDVTKYVSIAQQNRSAQPVEPTRKGVGAGNEKRKTPEERVEAVNEARATTESNLSVQVADVQKLVDGINGIMKRTQLRLRLTINEEAKLFITKLIDEKSGEIIREFPAKEIQSMVVRLREMMDDMDQGGKRVLVDKKS